MRQSWEEPHSNYVNINGISVHYKKFGHHNDSIPIVLIPSYNFSGYIYDNMVKNLSKKRDCYVIDLPNTGLSENFKTNKKLNLNDFSNFLNDFLEELNIQRSYLVGQGFGSEVVMKFSINYPEKVEKIIVINPLGRQEQNKNSSIYFSILNIPYLGEWLYSVKPQFLVRNFYESLFSGGRANYEPLFKRFSDEFNRTGSIQRLNFILRDTLNNRINNYQLIQIPALIIESEKGFYYQNSLLAKIKSQVPTADTASIKNGGQLPMICYPDKLNKLIFAYINGKKL